MTEGWVSGQMSKVTETSCIHMTNTWQMGKHQSLEYHSHQKGARSLVNCRWPPVVIKLTTETGCPWDIDWPGMATANSSSLVHLLVPHPFHSATRNQKPNKQTNKKHQIISCIHPSIGLAGGVSLRYRTSKASPQNIKSSAPRRVLIFRILRPFFFF